MGLIVDTSIAVASDRRGESAELLIETLMKRFGTTPITFSAVSAVELTHGIYRGKSEEVRNRRRTFVEELLRDLSVIPLTLQIAQLAGRIEGEQAAKGVVIAIEDLLIGATALHLGYDVLTLNLRHFKLIPGLRVVTL